MLNIGRRRAVVALLCCSSVAFAFQAPRLARRPAARPPARAAPRTRARGQAQLTGDCIVLWTYAVNQFVLDTFFASVAEETLLFEPDRMAVFASPTIGASILSITCGARPPISSALARARGVLSALPPPFRPYARFVAVAILQDAYAIARTRRDVSDAVYVAARSSTTALAIIVVELAVIGAVLGLDVAPDYAGFASGTVPIPATWRPSSLYAGSCRSDRRRSARSPAPGHLLRSLG